MHRQNKLKDYRRRAWKLKNKLAKPGIVKLGTRLIPDKRGKPDKHRKPFTEDV